MALVEIIGKLAVRDAEFIVRRWNGVSARGPTRVRGESKTVTKHARFGKLRA